MPRSSSALLPVCRGFTLIELLTVMSIVAVLAAFVFRAGHSAFSKSASGRVSAELTSLRSALEAYKIAYGDYPRTSDPAVLLQCLIGKCGPTGHVVQSRSHMDLGHFTTGAGRDPYTTTTAQIVDPWAQPYRYAYKSSMPWTRRSYLLFSSGPDQLHAPLLSGGQIDETAEENRDNVYSER